MPSSLRGGPSIDDAVGAGLHEMALERDDGCVGRRVGRARLADRIADRAQLPLNVAGIAVPCGLSCRCFRP